jgi:hypothetical protein
VGRENTKRSNARRRERRLEWLKNQSQV